MKTILTVLGARPQFIKASVVSDAIRRASPLKEVVVHTGQHFDANMSDVFFSELGMEPPAYQLDIHGGTHGDMTGRMLVALEKLMMEKRPDAVLVYGDTNSTLAGALAACKLHIPVAHVEAGLRSFNMAMPEEINRIVTDRVSQWLYAPTEVAAGNLAREGVAQQSIVRVGDVMYDVALFQAPRAGPGGVLSKLGLQPSRFVLATIHRAENTDDTRRLSVIIDALSLLARHMTVVWPMHPRTHGTLEKMDLLGPVSQHLHIIEPVGYIDMVRLERHAALIVTDSGGVQKEAFFHKVPCVTVREETEWTELVDAGWNRLVPLDDPHAIADIARAAIGQRGKDIAPYGAGDAALKIARHLAENVD